jgi:hypothetical protein
MKFVGVMVALISLIFLFTCSDKGTSNSDAAKEIAKIFFVSEDNIDAEEIAGVIDNRITCKQVDAFGPGIIVSVKNYDGREFQLEIDNVTTTGIQSVTSYVQYKDAKGEIFQTTGAGLPDTEISWWENLSMCEFKYRKTPVQLFSNSGSSSVLLDSLRIETLREDD